MTPLGYAIAERSICLCGVLLDVLIGINMSNNCCSFIFKDLSSFGMVPMIVTVEEVLDRSTAKKIKS